VRCFQYIDIEIVIHKDGATYRSDPNCLLSDLKIVNSLCHQPMGNAMVTSGTEMKRDVDQAFRAFENKFHIFLQ
jgi:hypothetical protein